MPHNDDVTAKRAQPSQHIGAMSRHSDNDRLPLLSASQGDLRSAASKRKPVNCAGASVGERRATGNAESSWQKRQRWRVSHSKGTAKGADRLWAARTSDPMHEERSVTLSSIKGFHRLDDGWTADVGKIVSDAELLSASLPSRTKPLPQLVVKPQETKSESTISNPHDDTSTQSRLQEDGSNQTNNPHLPAASQAQAKLPSLENDPLSRTNSRLTTPLSRLSGVHTEVQERSRSVSDHASMMEFIQSVKRLTCSSDALQSEDQLETTRSVSDPAAVEAGISRATAKRSTEDNSKLAQYKAGVDPRIAALKAKTLGVLKQSALKLQSKFRMRRAREVTELVRMAQLQQRAPQSQKRKQSYVLGNDVIAKTGVWAGAVLSQSCKRVGAVIDPLSVFVADLRLCCQHLSEQLSPRKYHHPRHESADTTEGESTTQTTETFSLAEENAATSPLLHSLQQQLREAERISRDIDRRMHVEVLRAKIMLRQLSRHNTAHPCVGSSVQSSNSDVGIAIAKAVAAQRTPGQPYSASTTTGYWPVAGEEALVARMGVGELIKYAQLHPIKVRHPDNVGLLRAIWTESVVDIVRLIVLQETDVNASVKFIVGCAESSGEVVVDFEHRDSLIGDFKRFYAIEMPVIVAAVLTGSRAVVETLVHLGVDVSVALVLPECFGGGYVSPMLLSVYIDGVGNGTDRDIFSLIHSATVAAAEGDYTGQVDEFHRTYCRSKATPLHLAAFCGHQQAAKAMLETYNAASSLAKATTSNGATPVFIASARAHSNVLSLLLAVPGVDVDAIIDTGASPLYVAAQAGSSECVRQLVQAGATVDRVARFGMTPLGIAICSGVAVGGVAGECSTMDVAHNAVVEILTDFGNPSTAKNAENFTVPMLAALVGDFDALAHMERKGFVDSAVRNYEGERVGDMLRDIFGFDINEIQRVADLVQELSSLLDPTLLRTIASKFFLMFGSALPASQHADSSVVWKDSDFGKVSRHPIRYLQNEASSSKNLMAQEVGLSMNFQQMHRALSSVPILSMQLLNQHRHESNEKTAATCLIMQTIAADKANTASSLLRHRFDIFVSLQFHALDLCGNGWISAAQFARVFRRFVMVLAVKPLLAGKFSQLLNVSMRPVEVTPSALKQTSGTFDKNSLTAWSSEYLALSLTSGLVSQNDMRAALSRFQQAAGDSESNTPGLSAAALRGLLKARNTLKHLAQRIREKLIEIFRNIRYKLLSPEAKAFEDHKAWPPEHQVAMASKLSLSELIEFAEKHALLVAQYVEKKQAEEQRRKSVPSRPVPWNSLLHAPDAAKLYEAVTKDDIIGIVRAIVLFGTDVDSVINDKTTLMVAAGCGASKACAALLRLKAQLNYVDRDGVTALAIACSNGHEDIALQILQRRRPLMKPFDDPLNEDLFPMNETKSASTTSTRSNNTPSDAVKHGTRDVDLSNGRGLAIVDPRVPFIRRGRGTTALHLACGNGLVAAVTAIITHASRHVAIWTHREQSCCKSLSQLHEVCSSLERRKSDLERQIKFLQQKSQQLDNKTVMPLSSKSSGAPTMSTDDDGGNGDDDDSADEFDNVDAMREAERLRRLEQNKKRTSASKWEQRAAKDAARAAEAANRRESKRLAKLSKALEELQRVCGQLEAVVVDIQKLQKQHNVFANRKRVAHMERVALFNARTAAGLTPLFVAAAAGHSAVVEALVNHATDQAAASPAQQVDLDFDGANRKGATALYACAQCGHLDICHILVKCGASVNSTTVYGLSPLHIAIFGGHGGVVKLLLEHGATQRTRDSLGNTEAMTAAQLGHFDILAMLTRFGASPSARNRSGDAMEDLLWKFYKIRLLNACAGQRPTDAARNPQDNADEDVLLTQSLNFFAKFALLPPENAPRHFNPATWRRLSNNELDILTEAVEAGFEVPTSPLFSISLRKNQELKRRKAVQFKERIESSGVLTLEEFCKALHYLEQSLLGDKQGQLSATQMDQVAAIYFHAYDAANNGFVRLDSFRKVFRRLYVRMQCIERAVAPNALLDFVHVSWRPPAPLGQLLLPMQLHPQITPDNYSLYQTTYDVNQMSSEGSGIVLGITPRSKLLLDALMDGSFARQRRMAVIAQQESLRWSRLTQQQKDDESRRVPSERDRRSFLFLLSQITADTLSADIEGIKRKIEPLMGGRSCSGKSVCKHDGPPHAWRMWADIPEGWTGLMVACRGGNSQFVEFLLQKNASNSICKFQTPKVGEGENALLVAVRHGHSDVVNTLIAAVQSAKDKHFLINCSNDCLETPIFLATLGGESHCSILNTLLKHGACIVAIPMPEDPDAQHFSTGTRPRSATQYCPNIPRAPFGESLLSVATTMSHPSVMVALTNHVRNILSQPQSRKTLSTCAILRQQLCQGVHSFQNTLNPLQTLLIQCKFDAVQQLLPLYDLVDAKARQDAEDLCQEVFSMSIASAVQVASKEQMPVESASGSCFWFGCNHRDSGDTLYYDRVATHDVTRLAKAEVLQELQSCWNAQQQVLSVPAEILKIQVCTIEELCSFEELAARRADPTTTAAGDREYVELLREQASSTLKRNVTQQFSQCLNSLERALRQWISAFDSAESLIMEERGPACTPSGQTLVFRANVVERVGPKWLPSLINTVARKLLLELRSQVYKLSSTQRGRCTAGGFSCVSAPSREKMLFSNASNGEQPSATGSVSVVLQCAETVFDKWIIDDFCDARGIAATFQLFGRETQLELNDQAKRDYTIQRAMHASKWYAIITTAGTAVQSHSTGNSAALADVATLIRSAACGDSSTVLRQLCRVGVPIFSQLPSLATLNRKGVSLSFRGAGTSFSLTNELVGSTCLRAAVLGNNVATVEVILRIIHFAADTQRLGRQYWQVRKDTKLEVDADCNVVSFEQTVKNDTKLSTLSTKDLFQAFDSYNCRTWLTTEQEDFPRALTIPALRELAAAAFVSTYRGFCDCLEAVFSGIAQSFGPHIARFILAIRCGPFRWSCLHFAAQRAHYFSSADDANQAHNSTDDQSSACLRWLLSVISGKDADAGMKLSLQSVAAPESWRWHEPVLSPTGLLQAKEASADATALFVAVAAQNPVHVKIIAQAIRLVLMDGVKTNRTSMSSDGRGSLVAFFEPPHPGIAPSSPAWKYRGPVAESQSRSGPETASSHGSTCTSVETDKATVFNLDVACYGARSVSSASTAVLMDDNDSLLALCHASQGLVAKTTDAIRTDEDVLAVEGYSLLSIAVALGHATVVTNILDMATKVILANKQSSESVESRCNLGIGVVVPGNLFSTSWTLDSDRSPNSWLEPSMLAAVIVGEITLLPQLLRVAALLRAKPTNKDADKISDECLIEPVHRLTFDLGDSGSWTLTTLCKRIYGFDLLNELLSYFREAGEEPTDFFPFKKSRTFLNKRRTIGLVNSQVELQARRAFAKYSGDAPLRGKYRHHVRFCSHYRCLDTTQPNMSRMSLAQFERMVTEKFKFDTNLFGSSDESSGSIKHLFSGFCSMLFARFQDGSGTIPEHKFITKFPHLLYLDTLSRTRSRVSASPVLPGDTNQHTSSSICAGDRVRYCGPMNDTYAWHPGALLNGQRHPWKFADTGTVSKVRRIPLSKWKRKESVPLDKIPGRREMLEKLASTPGTVEFRRRVAELERQKREESKPENTQVVEEESTGALAEFLEEKAAADAGAYITVVDVMWDNVLFDEVERIEHVTLLSVTKQEQTDINEGTNQKPTKQEQPPQDEAIYDAANNSNLTKRERRRIRERAEAAAAEKAALTLAPIPGGKITPSSWIGIIERLHPPLNEWYKFLWPIFYGGQHVAKPTSSDDQLSFPTVPSSREMAVAYKWYSVACNVLGHARPSADHKSSQPALNRKTVPKSTTKAVDLQGALNGFRIY